MTAAGYPNVGPEQATEMMLVRDDNAWKWWQAETYDATESRGLVSDKLWSKVEAGQTAESDPDIHPVLLAKLKALGAL